MINIYFLIIAICIYIIIRAFTIKNLGDIIDRIYSAFFSIFLVFGASVTLLFIFEKKMNTVRQEQFMTNSIVSLERTEAQTGSFILGTGYINSTLYYIMYEKIGKDTYKILRVDAEKCILKESNKEPGIYRQRYIKNFLYIFKHEYMNERKIIYVPFGTIIKEFKA